MEIAPVRGKARASYGVRRALLGLIAACVRQAGRQRPFRAERYTWNLVERKPKTPRREDEREWTIGQNAGLAGPRFPAEPWRGRGPGDDLGPLHDGEDGRAAERGCEGRSALLVLTRWW
jgi:hypothetical protein